MTTITPDKLQEQLKNEENTKRKYITPVIEERWGKDTDHIVMEYYFTAGRVNIDGEKVSRGEQKKADYMLLYHNNTPLALVEAKGLEHSAMEGYQQVIEYATILDIPFAYSTNGIELIEQDMLTGLNNSDMKMNDFPYPEELWERYSKEKGLTAEDIKLINQPYYLDTSKADPKKPRYYQRIAINRVMEAIAQGKTRLLLVMATGTGKTFTAFQIVWRLWKAKIKRKILYLVDRNTLADQTMQKDFKPFVDAGVMRKIKAETIKKDTAYEVYTALYQQLKSKEKDYYKELPPDFFDLIIVDECHRGSASEDSTWHEILEYFASATQIGLTATPKETEDISNIGYFCSETDDKPIYTYSLKQGIEDGFLAPYRVISVELDIDEKGYIPKPGEVDIHGKPLENRIYEQKEFDRTIAIESRREAVARRITDYMKDNECRFAKTIVFCENIEHVDAMVLKLKNFNHDLVAENLKYVMKITGDDEIGKAELENFTDPNTQYPVIAVTSKLMSTGVDSETCEIIVLDKTIGSMTEFKQTIGRGTRINENFTIAGEKKSKLHFTILDFRKNYKKFEDPGFDGEPVSIANVDDTKKFPKGTPQEITTGENGATRHFEKAFVKGQAVNIEDEIVQYRDENGNLVRENIDSCVRNNILDQYPSYEAFYTAFRKSNDKNKFLDELLLSKEFIKKMQEQIGYHIDKFDIAALVGYKVPPISKEERLEKIKIDYIIQDLDSEKKAIIEAILNEYRTQDFSDLLEKKVFKLPVLQSMGYTPLMLNQVFDGRFEGYVELMRKIEGELY